MKKRNVVKILISLFYLAVLLLAMAGCTSTVDSTPKIKDLADLYNDEGIVEPENLIDYFFDQCADDEYAQKKLESYFLEEFDTNDFYLSKGEVDETSVKDYAETKELIERFTSEYTDTEPTEPENSGTYYILNTSSKKYHTSSCSFGKRTSEQNKEISYETSEEIAARGYSPCGKCHP